MVKEGIALRHKISKRGIEVDRAKIKVIEKLPPPISLKGVQSFLVHAGFYRRFIKDFSEIAYLLFRFLEKEVKFNFTEACLKAFECLKEKLITAPIIVSQDCSLPFEIICDVSGLALGVVLGQQKEKILHLIYCASKALNPTYKNYIVTKQELLAQVKVLFDWDKGDCVH